MRHLLIVDDERGYRDLYEQVLGDAGFATESAADAEEKWGQVPISSARNPAAPTRGSDQAAGSKAQASRPDESEV